MLELVNPLAVGSILFALLGAAIMVWYLVRRPALVTATKIALLFGILIFPLGAAFSGNLHGYTVSQKREFCGSCHVMTPYTDDSVESGSKTLAAMHGKNPWFGDHNCYTCHADYGMFGTVVTKINGLNHVWMYATVFDDVPLEESLHRIRLYTPFKNTACLQCHSTRTKGWNAVKDHESAADEIRAEQVSCASGGCHGPAHPFSKKAEELEVSKGSHP